MRALIFIKSNGIDTSHFVLGGGGGGEWSEGVRIVTDSISPRRPRLAFSRRLRSDRLRDASSLGIIPRPSAAAVVRATTDRRGNGRNLEEIKLNKIIFKKKSSPIECHLDRDAHIAEAHDPEEPRRDRNRDETHRSPARQK